MAMRVQQPGKTTSFRRSVTSFLGAALLFGMGGLMPAYAANGTSGAAEAPAPGAKIMATPETLPNQNGKNLPEIEIGEVTGQLVGHTTKGHPELDAGNKIRFGVATTQGGQAIPSGETREMISTGKSPEVKSGENKTALVSHGQPFQVIPKKEDEKYFLKLGSGMEYELEHNKTYIFERYSGQTTIRSAGTSNRFQLTEAQSDLVSRIKNLDVRQYVFYAGAWYPLRTSLYPPYTRLNPNERIEDKGIHYLPRKIKMGQLGDGYKIGNGHSVLAFKPIANEHKVKPGEKFPIGMFTHYNNRVTIVSGAPGVFLGNIKVGILGQTFSFPYTLTETDNGNDSTADEADDTLSFDKETNLEKKITVGNVEYTLRLHGFSQANGHKCENKIDDSQIDKPLKTKENQQTSGCLWASLEQVRTLQISKELVNGPESENKNEFSFGIDSRDVTFKDPEKDLQNLKAKPTTTGKGGRAKVFTTPAKFVVGKELSIEEKDLPANWKLDSAKCYEGSDKDEKKPLMGVTLKNTKLTLPANLYAKTTEDLPITCVFTNKYDSPKAKLTLKKEVKNEFGGQGVLDEKSWSGKLTAQRVDNSEGKPTVHSGAFEFKDGKWQKQEIDPGKYELKEETLNGYAFESLVCKDAKKPEKSAESPIELVTAGDKHFIDLKPGQDVECTFTNKQIPGEITWEKVDAEAKEKLLEGSEWTLVRKGGIDKDKISVVENGEKDTEKTNGKFHVKNLAWGEWELVETKAPFGYLIDASQKKTITIGPDKTQQNLGKIENQKAHTPVIPLTGGMGTQSIVLGGLFLLGIAGFAVIRSRRAHA